MLDSQISYLRALNLRLGFWDGRRRVVPIVAPYWERLFRLTGGAWQPTFIMDIVVPPPHGWNVALIHPRAGVPFVVDDPMDRFNPGGMLVTIPKAPRSNEEVTVEIVQRVLDAPDIPFFRMRHVVRLAVGDSRTDRIDTIDHRSSEPAHRAVVTKAQVLAVDRAVLTPSKDYVTGGPAGGLNPEEQIGREAKPKY